LEQMGQMGQFPPDKGGLRGVSISNTCDHIGYCESTPQAITEKPYYRHPPLKDRHPPTPPLKGGIDQCPPKRKRGGGDSVLIAF
jgi:hypothetical protein